MKKAFLIAGLGLSLLAVSCSPYQIRTDYDRAKNFTQYHSYRLDVADLKLNDIDMDRVTGEVKRQMQTKGILLNEENPDMIIKISAGHQKINEVNTLPYGMWGGWGWGGLGMGWGRTWTQTYHSGHLNFDIKDARTQRLIWQGTGSGLLVDSPEKKQVQIPDMIAQILAHFPPGSQNIGR